LAKHLAYFGKLEKTPPPHAYMHGPHDLASRYDRSPSRLPGVSRAGLFPLRKEVYRHYRLPPGPISVDRAGHFSPKTENRTEMSVFRFGFGF
jgi:hypothetical protein